MNSVNPRVQGKDPELDGTSVHRTPQRSKPKCIGLVMAATSGSDTPQHAVTLRRHAQELGYCYLYTVRPPQDHTDPVGYALNIAIGVQAAALIVYDLATVDNTLSRVCSVCDLETVSPPQTWAAALPNMIDPAHAYPDRPLTVAEAREIMQQHVACRAVACPRKSSAYRCLVKAGKILPPIGTPRERAAARGVPFPRLDAEPPMSDSPDIATLLAVLDGLCEPDADPRAQAARLTRGRHG